MTPFKVLRVATAFAMSVSSTISPVFAEEMCKKIGSEWTWFGDHVAFTVDYYVAGPEARQFEVGTGMSVNGSVWGSTQHAKDFLEVTAYGAGAIHVRKYDQGEDFEVCVGVDRMTVIDLCGKKWLGYNNCPTF